MLDIPADFFKAVQLLRQMHERHRHHCLYMASFFNDEQIAEAERAGLIFGHHGAIEREVLQ